MSKRNQHVVPHPGGWAVKPEGGERASSVHPTQQDAIDEGARWPAIRGPNCSSTGGMGASWSGTATDTTLTRRRGR